MQRTPIKITTYESPCGTLMLGSIDDMLCLCDWSAAKRCRQAVEKLKRALNSEIEEGTSAVIEKAAAQLDEYLAGQRTAFDVPLLFVGTDFQKTIWNELRKIAFGTTVSYGEIARQIGMPKAVRAVANAIGANVISIFVPCHRVVGSNRLLSGYRGGPEAKLKLLDREDCSFSK